MRTRSTLITAGLATFMASCGGSDHHMAPIDGGPGTDSPQQDAGPDLVPNAPPPMWTFAATGEAFATELFVAADSKVIVSGFFVGDLMVGATSLHSARVHADEQWDLFAIGLDGDASVGFATFVAGAVGRMDYTRHLAGTSAGSFALSTRFDPTAQAGDMMFTSVGSADSLIARYDAQGVLGVATQLGAGGPDEISAVAAGPAGGVIVAGKTNADLDATSGVFVDGTTTRPFVARVSAAGRIEWATFGAGSALADAVAVDANGNAFVTYYVHNGDDLGGGAISTIGADAQLASAVASYDDTGHYRWSHVVSSDSYDADSWGREVITDGAGNAYFAWANGGTLEGDLVTEGLADLDGTLVVKLGPSGEAAWAVRLGGPGGLAGTKLALDSHGSIIALVSSGSGQDAKPTLIRVTGDGGIISGWRITEPGAPRALAIDVNNNSIYLAGRNESAMFVSRYPEMR